MLVYLLKKLQKQLTNLVQSLTRLCSIPEPNPIVQLYCKMGKQGDDARVTGWEAVYPPNFQGTVEIDGSKNYYSKPV